MSVVKTPRSAASQRSLAGPQTQDTEATELDPEGMTPEQLADTLEREEIEDVMAKHMESLHQKVMDECFSVDIRLQVFPYAANWAKKYLVQKVEEQFLCRDEGDGPEDVLPEDSEPPPAEPDAWAQGCVPLVINSIPLRPISPKEEDVVYKEEELEVLPKCRAVPQPKVSAKLPLKKTSSKPAVVTGNTLYNSFPQPKTEKKNNQVPKSAKLIKLLPPLSHSIAKETSKTSKTQVEIKMSTVSNKSIPSTVSNKQKAIQKLNPASLPDHCILPTYEIVDVTQVKPKKIREIKAQQKHMQPEQTAQPQICDADIRQKHGAGPIRLEAMTLSKGVTLSQSGGMSQITAPPQTPPLKLEPIRTEPIRTEPIRTEPIRTEPIRTEPIRTEPVLVFSDKQFVPDP